MGRAGRFACILTPMLATAATLALLIVVMLGGTNQSSSVLDGLYFMRVDTRYIEAPDRLDLFKGIPGANNIYNESSLDTSIQSAAAEIGLYDFYDVHLWNYCAGKYHNDTGNWEITTCSKASFGYWFDPLDMFGTTAAGEKNITFPAAVRDAVKPIQGVSKAMNVAFAIAAVATAVEFVVGWFGLLSRWGSCCTTIVAGIASSFVVLAAGLMSGLFFAVSAAFNKSLDDFGVQASVNRHTLSLVWIAVVLSWGAGFFWLLSTCCCSGRRDKIMSGGKASRGGEKGHSYERVASPYHGTSSNIPLVPQQQGVTGPTYEPMRHSKV